MPEDTGTPEDGTQDAPTTDDAPTESPVETPVDYETRYNDLRPQYDRTMAENQQYAQFVESLQNPETQAQALEALGLELSALEDEEDDDYEDPTDQRLEQIEGFLAQQAEQAQQQELEDLEVQFLDKEIAALEAKEGELTQQELGLLVALADVTRDDQGLPDVQTAYEQLKGVTEARQQRYLQSKKAAALAPGTAGSESIDLKSQDGRHQAGIDAVAAVLDQEASS